MGLPRHQGRIGDPSDLAPERGPRQGPHPGLLLGLRLMEDAGRLDEEFGPRRRATNAARRNDATEKRRYHADRARPPRRPHTPGYVALRHGTQRRPSSTPSASRAASATPPPPRGQGGSNV